ncbi:MAG TPA: glycosyltransferase family 2 protein [Galbitalea sp.]|jgi:GT2 family glycosyltransferase|nr:glycosyltransferase family 2 protein [Galbitalea sp.]
MQPRVTAILVARNGEAYLGQTLAALNSQTRRPDALVTVDAGSRDDSASMLAAAAPTQAISTAARSSFGSSIERATRVALPPAVPDEWLWLLGADNVPASGALAALLGAVEIAPSVAVAGPKLMRSDEADIIARYGESITRYGASVVLVENELDQAQYDGQSDILAVSAAGMLVRRSVWDALGGFDPGLPSVDAGLDFSVRARLAGYRVIGVPTSRVSSAGGPELFGRTSLSSAASARVRRRAQLHRRMVYARGLAPLFLWLSLVPIAILRCLLQLLRKQPGLVGGELAAAFATAFDGTVPAARRQIRRNRKFGWQAIAPLRISPALARERRASRSTVGDDAAVPLRVRASFVSGGGVAVVLVAAVIGVIVFGRFLGATVIQGGALLPLSPTVAQLWANVGYGWHSVGSGFVGASDPFAAVLAVLGSITFWAPSFSIVLLYLVALPVTALGAWWCATRVASRAWPPAIAALVWAVAPPFLSSMEQGQLGAVIAHILLPWLALTVIAAARSWSAGAAAALLFAAVAACSPSVVPALVVLLVVWMAVNPPRVHRLIGIVIPAAALFAPLIYAQVQRGTPLDLFADPGLPTAHTPASSLQLAIGAADAGVSGWGSVQSVFGLSVIGPLVYAVLLVPLLLLALAAAFVPGSSRGIPALVIALLGFGTAVAAASFSFSTSGASTVTIWPGAALSLMWLGLTGAMVVTLEAMGRGAGVPAFVTVLASAIAVAPLLVAPLAASTPVEAGSGGVLPAYVDAVGATKPGIGTIILTPQQDGSLGAQLQRGAGDTLDDQSTLASTSRALTPERKSVLSLAGNLASRTGLDTTTTTMTSQRIGFVLLGSPGVHGAQAVHDRAEDALKGNAALAFVGDTGQGLLWRYPALPQTGLRDAAPSGGPARSWVLGGLGAVFLLALLLAVPIRGGRRRSSVATVTDERATLGEDDDA